MTQIYNNQFIMGIIVYLSSHFVSYLFNGVIEFYTAFDMPMMVEND